MACPLTPRTNDPHGGQKQIQLRYAAIGAGYGSVKAGQPESGQMMFPQFILRSHSEG
jgi:hypothetical protein